MQVVWDEDHHSERVLDAVTRAMQERERRRKAAIVLQRTVCLWRLRPRAQWLSCPEQKRCETSEPKHQQLDMVDDSFEDDGDGEPGDIHEIDEDERNDIDIGFELSQYLEPPLEWPNGVWRRSTQIMIVAGSHWQRRETYTVRHLEALEARRAAWQAKQDAIVLARRMREERIIARQKARARRRQEAHLPCLAIHARRYWAGLSARFDGAAFGDAFQKGTQRSMAKDDFFQRAKQRRRAIVAMSTGVSVKKKSWDEIAGPESNSHRNCGVGKIIRAARRKRSPAQRRPPNDEDISGKIVVEPAHAARGALAGGRALFRPWLDEAASVSFSVLRMVLPPPADDSSDDEDGPPCETHPLCLRRGRAPAEFGTLRVVAQLPTRYRPPPYAWAATVIAAIGRGVGPRALRRAARRAAAAKTIANFINSCKLGAEVRGKWKVVVEEARQFAREAHAATIREYNEKNAHARAVEDRKRVAQDFGMRGAVDEIVNEVRIRNKFRRSFGV